MPVLRERLQKSRFADFEVVKAGGGGRKVDPEKLQLVTIPVLKAVAASHGERGGHPSSLLSGPIESMIAAPKDWCPNPNTTSCLRVRGTSMVPLIPDGCIVAVDSSQADHMRLDGKIVVAWHKVAQRPRQRPRLDGFPIQALRSHRNSGTGESRVRVHNSKC